MNAEEELNLFLVMLGYCPKCFEKIKTIKTDTTTLDYCPNCGYML